MSYMSDSDFRDIFDCSKQDAAYALTRSVDPICVGFSDGRLKRPDLREQYRLAYTEMMDSTVSKYHFCGNGPTDPRTFALFSTTDGSATATCNLMLEFMGIECIQHVLGCLHNTFLRRRHPPRRGAASTWMQEVIYKGQELYSLPLMDPLQYQPPSRLGKPLEEVHTMDLDSLNDLSSSSTSWNDSSSSSITWNDSSSSGTWNDSSSSASMAVNVRVLQLGLGDLRLYTGAPSFRFDGLETPPNYDGPDFTAMGEQLIARLGIC